MIEEGAGVPRAWAEGLARLEGSRVPACIDEDRWRQIVDDAGRFLDEWSVIAAGSGWSTGDVFGLIHTIDNDLAGGLVLLIRGGSVIGITARHATIRTREGGHLTYLRGNGSRGAPIWTLLQIEAHPASG